MNAKLETLLTSLGMSTLQLPLAWAHVVLSGPFARPVTRLVEVLGVFEYDTEHKLIRLNCRDVRRLLPGQLVAVEIYVFPGRQARLYCEYVHAVDAAGNRSFRGTRLRPLTLNGLRLALRDARRVPAFHGRAHVTRPGVLFDDLGLSPDYAG